MNTGLVVKNEQDTLMFVKEPDTDHSWKYQKTKDGYVYTSAFGSVTIQPYPWHIEIRDANGKLLTETFHAQDNNGSYTPILPFSFVQRSSDFSRSIAASFTARRKKRSLVAANLLPILNKHGQKVVLWTFDVNGVQIRKCINRFHFS